jgi:small subunit ribosomal protein S8
MTMQDPIADMLIRIKNAQAVLKKTVSMPASKLKKNIANVLKDEGFITDFEEYTQDQKVTLLIHLKYYAGRGVIEQLDRVSKPGLRHYSGKASLPLLRKGLGVVIVSTSQGVMSDFSARQKGMGGEVLCYVS